MGANFSSFNETLYALALLGSPESSPDVYFSLRNPMWTNLVCSPVEIFGTVSPGTITVFS